MPPACLLVVLQTLAVVALLRKTDGFFGNHKVRIPLPGYLNDVAGLLKTQGQGKRIDEGKEEKKIRRDPVGTGSEILKKVFGAMR